MAAFFVFLASFAAYAWTASAAMGWLDSPEFVAAAASLGVPHSPGHPLPVLLGALANLLPVADLALRVSLVSALAAALAWAIVQITAERLLGRAAPDLPARLRQAMAIGLALVLAFSSAAWAQAVRAEVYALVALLFAAACHVALGLAAGMSRQLAAGALVAGLALATHHLVALTFLIPAVVCLGRATESARSTESAPSARSGSSAPRVARRSRLRTVSAVLCLGLLGLAVLCYLPLRSAQHPVVNWGAPHTFERLVWTVSARAFHKATTAEHVSTPAEDAAQVIDLLAGEASWFLLAGALLGLYLGVRARRTRAATLYLAGVLALGSGVRVLVGFDPGTPDHHGYLLPALAALVLLGGAGLAGLVSLVPAARARRWLGAGLVAGVFALSAHQLARSAPRWVTDDSSQELASWQLDGLPPRTLLLASYFQTSFRLMAMQAVEHARPDVTILHRGLLTYPGAAGEARLAHGELAALIDSPLAAGAPTPIDQLAFLARSRPVAIELDPGLEDAVHPWLVPAGPFAWFAVAPPRPGERDRLEAADVAAREDLARRLRDPAPGDAAGVRDVLLWHDFTRLRFYCSLGRGHAAQAAFDGAWALVPGDRSLASIARACHLNAP